ncbi:hypothetical protein BUALT_Bualt06G0058600 [Buddleja alternifolia]|uniref:BHLH domain-containing protein n=1 Tax=Buddleja alternifolia TaxID=168488 RepID=A0AAV6XNY9_9LAMI|nr:hypothetical protein BUALT_Bualt06G0058600 [Buddleja alternifolia]
MENCFWPEGYYAAHCQSELDGPCLPGDEAAAALQYHCYPPATATPTALQLWAPPFEGAAEDRSASASRTHSEAEKRRRDRINAQLATLRKLIPKSEKMDKAALLGHVVDHVKEQSKKAKEVSKFSNIPTEIDEVTIDHLNAEEETISNNNENIYMKASVCCDDRPELFAELNSAIKGVGFTIIQADITSVGGRMKTNFVLCSKGEQDSSVASLKKLLKLVLSRVVIPSGASSYSARSKRQRFFYPNSY